MKSDLVVSIITPTFNQCEFIEDCIRSVKDQSYSKIEHIIIDGASTDNTLKVIKKYEKSYNLKWISEEDQGQAEAIIKGFNMATGDIVAWLNSDDFYMHKDVVREIVELFKKFPLADVVTGKGYYVDRKGNYVEPIFGDKSRINIKNMRITDHILQPSTFVRSKLNKKVKIDMKYTYVFDWLYFLNMFELGANFLVVDNYFSAYRMYEDNKTGLDNAKRKLEVYEMAKRNFGSYHSLAIYCYFIYKLYYYAEFLPLNIGCRIKKITRLLNFFINKFTFGKINSC